MAATKEGPKELSVSREMNVYPSAQSNLSIVLNNQIAMFYSSILIQGKDRESKLQLIFQKEQPNL